jgi:hypothetical protein
MQMETQQIEFSVNSLNGLFRGCFFGCAIACFGGCFGWQLLCWFSSLVFAAVVLAGVLAAGFVRIYALENYTR